MFRIHESAPQRKKVGFEVQSTKPVRLLKHVTKQTLTSTNSSLDRKSRETACKHLNAHGKTNDPMERLQIGSHHLDKLLNLIVSQDKQLPDV